MGTLIRTDSLEGKEGDWYVYAISLVAALGGFLFGFDLSIISGAIIFLAEQFHLTAAAKGFAVSSAILGCIVGPLLSLWLADAIGRKKTLALASLFFLISAIGSALSIGLIDFVIWRWLGGVGVGLAATTAPMYIAEISPPRLRGRLVTVNQLAIVSGINISVIVSYVLSFGGHWRWMFASAVVPILALMGGLFFVPRSPRWLASKGKKEEALAVLTKVNGRGRAEVELEEINEELGKESGGFGELVQPGMRLALIIGIVIMIFSQVNGVNMMILYAPTILMEAGIGSASKAILNTLYVNFLILLCTVVAFWLVSHFGRRRILLIGVTGMALGHIFMSLAFGLKLPPVFMMTAMFVGTGSFTLSLAPLSWVIISEIFPNRIRGKAMSVVCCCLYSSSFICAEIFPLITAKFDGRFGNPGGAYLIFFAICSACVLFVWRMVPETKDLTLEEISNFWLRHENTARKNRA